MHSARRCARQPSITVAVGVVISTDPDADVYVPENEMYYGPALPLETNRYCPLSALCATWRKRWRKLSISMLTLMWSILTAVPMIIREEDRTVWQNILNHGGVITYKQNDFPDGSMDLERGLSDPPVYPGSLMTAWNNITWCMVQNPKYRSASSVMRYCLKKRQSLLNVGPVPFHPDAVKEWYAIGDWLKINGEQSMEVAPSWKVPIFRPAQNYDASKIERAAQGPAPKLRWKNKH